MINIVPHITSALQYLADIKNNNIAKYRPKCCPHCRGFMRILGKYYRKPDRDNKSEFKNPVPILRFYCKNCRISISVLPTFIPPRRWYMWIKQQAVIALALLNQSVRSISEQTAISRRTISRWVSWIEDKFLVHKDAICNHFSKFGVNDNYKDFWKMWFKDETLAQAMYLCHIENVIVP